MMSAGATCSTVSVTLARTQQQSEGNQKRKPLLVSIHPLLGLRRLDRWKFNKKPRLIPLLCGQAASHLKPAMRTLVLVRALVLDVQLEIQPVFHHDESECIEFLENPSYRWR